MGVGMAGATLEAVIDGERVDSTAVNAQGEWALELAVPLALGQSVVARQTVSEQESDSSAPFPVGAAELGGTETSAAPRARIPQAHDLRITAHGTDADGAASGSTPGATPGALSRRLWVDRAVESAAYGARNSVGAELARAESVPTAALLWTEQQVQQGAALPRVESLTPSAGASDTQTFTFNFSDPDGAADLAVVNFLFNDFLDGRHACYLGYVPSGPTSGSWFLVDDDGNAGGPYAGMTIPSNETIANSQCEVSGVGSSATGGGVALALTLSITFKPSFRGDKVVYMAARDAGAGNSGWQPMGVRSVAPPALPAPFVTMLLPDQGQGAEQSFTVTYRDASNGNNVRTTQLLINNALDGAGACYLGVDHAHAAKPVYLLNDAGDGLLPAVIPGDVHGMQQNSQCQLFGEGTSRVVSGPDVAVNFRLAFKTPFNGRKIAYAAVQTDGGNSGWQSVGGWTAGNHYGDLIAGSIDSIGEQDRHVFVGAAGDRVLLRLTSGFRPRISIRRPDDTQLCAADNQFSNLLQVECLLDVGGSYSILVTDRNVNQTGGYAFSLNRLSPPADPAPVIYGQTVTGSQDPAADLSFHSFSGAAGDRVLLRLTSAFRPHVSLRRPDGTQLCVADNQFSNFLQLECLLDVAGSYALLVTDRNFNQSGAYTFSLNRLNPPADPAPVIYGQTVTGSQDPAADLSFHSFSGAVGDRVLLRLTSAFRPHVSLRRPDGTQLCVADNQFSNFLQLECLLDVAGSYALLVTDRNFNQSGAYTFSLNRLNPPADPAPVIYGQTVTGSQDPAADLSFHSFSGAVGDRVLLRLTSAFRPHVSLRRPDGTQLCVADNQFSNFLQLECLLDVAGSYALLVTDRNFNQSGAYTFSLNRLNPPADPAPVIYGQTVTGSQDPAADLSFHSFSGAVGDRVLLRLTSAFRPHVSLRRPDGTQLCVADNQFSNFLQLECLLDVAGSYALLVTDRNFNQSGAYTFSLNRLNPPADPAPVIYGQTVTGSQDPAADLSFHSFSGAVGDRVLLRLTSAFRPHVSLRRPDGTQLCAADSQFSNQVQVECVLDGSGAHAILVTDRNFNQTGAYDLTLSKLE